MRKTASTRGFRVLATVFLCCMLLSSAVAFAADKEAGDEPLQWGVYQILWSRDYCDQLAEELESFASKPDYVMFFRDLASPYPKFAVDCIAKQKATAVVSLELWEWHGGRDGSYLEAIRNGDYDERLRRWAEEARADGRRMILRFGFEFNGDWFTWSGNPAVFVDAWRHGRRIFDEVGATNVEWAWSPNVVSCPDTPENRAHLYYPGDRYVDWVGVDGYNFGDKYDRWHKWQGFEDVFSDVLRGFEKRYPSKPVMITEFGCAAEDSKRCSVWIRQAHKSLQRYRQVKAAVWFNYDKRREGEPNWRIDAAPGSLRAFNDTFAAPRKKPS